MCYNGKCMYCLEVETGALIFAIFNVILTSLGSVLSIVGLIYTLLFVDEVMREHNVLVENRGQLMMVGVAGNLVFGVLAVGFCIGLAFAVVLIVGLCKRKAGLVKCYFVYGVIIMVCGAAILLGLVCSVGVIMVLGPVLLGLIIHLLYGLILFMVRMTYKKFESEVAFNYDVVS